MTMVAVCLTLGACGLNNGDEWRNKTWVGFLLVSYADEQILLGSDALRSSPLSRLIAPHKTRRRVGKYSILISRDAKFHELVCHSRFFIRMDRFVGSG